MFFNMYFLWYVSFIIMSLLVDKLVECLNHEELLISKTKRKHEQSIEVAKIALRGGLSLLYRDYDSLGPRTKSDRRAEERYLEASFQEYRRADHLSFLLSEHVGGQ